MLDDRGNEVVIGRTRGVDADEKLPGKLFEIWDCIIINTDKDRSLRIESFAIKNLRGVSTKLYLELAIMWLKRDQVS